MIAIMYEHDWMYSMLGHEQSTTTCIRSHQDTHTIGETEQAFDDCIFQSCLYSINSLLGGDWQLFQGFRHIRIGIVTFEPFH